MMTNEPTLAQDDGYEAFHHYQQQQAEFEEWKDSHQAIDYINSILLDLAYEEQYEIEV